MTWRALERALDHRCGEHANPLRHLGALAGLMLALLLATGAWLFAVYDTSASGAHASVAALARQPFAGGLVRSLHRYAADAVLLLTWLHLVREWALGRQRLFRRTTWWTGLPLLPMSYLVAVGGMWLAWDELAQYAAVASARWLDALPLVGGGFARQFDVAVPDRLFSLLVFVHTGIALLLLFALWFHLQRLARPALWPPRPLALGTLAGLLALALLWPVRSSAPADLAREPLALPFDWWLLHWLPLADIAPGWTWLLVAAVLGVLALLPFAGRAPAAAAAVVDPANCNGCGRCVDDCPYVAVQLLPREGGDALAVVDADRCAGCGLCAGACPSATPFRSDARLANGIDLPERTVDALREALRAGLAAQPGTVVVFGCVRGAEISGDPGEERPDGVRTHGIAASWWVRTSSGRFSSPAPAPPVLTLELACVGQLPPAFIDYALRQGAAGVLVAACADCEFRHGEQIAHERLIGLREPRLRARVPASRWRLLRAAPGEEARLTQVIDALRARAE